MKRKVISVLALTLVVLMSAVLVSCDGWKQVAPDEVVKEVVADIKAQYTYFKVYINDLAFGTHTPTELETTLKVVLENDYQAKWGAGTTAVVNASASSISAKVNAPDGKNSLDINFTSIKLSDNKESVSGSFSINVKKPDTAAASTHSFETAGNFTIAARDSVTFSSVSYRGTDYDTGNFNTEMERELP